MSDSKPVRLLVGFADAIAAPESVWSLTAAGFTPIVFRREGQPDPLAGIRGIESIMVPTPEVDVEACVGGLTEAVRRSGITAMLPLDDASLWLLRRIRADLGTPLAAPCDEAIETALDKSRQIEAARNAGFEVPPTVHFNSVEDLGSFDWTPAYLKPALAARVKEGRLVRAKGYFCSTREEVEQVARDWDPTEPGLAQAFRQGVGEGIFGFATDEGVTAWCGHRRIRMMNPNGSGSSACESAPVQDDLKEKTERFLQDIGWRGLFMIEMLRDREGVPWFMELNGRCWGSMALARRLGFEYPAWNVRQLLDPVFIPEIPEGRTEKIVCRHLGRELVHLLFVLRGPRRNAVTGWPGRWETLKALMKREDNTRWYNYQPGESSVFWRDVWRTVTHQVFKDRS